MITFVKIQGWAIAVSLVSLLSACAPCNKHLHCCKCCETDYGQSGPPIMHPLTDPLNGTLQHHVVAKQVSISGNPTVVLGSTLDTSQNARNIRAYGRDHENSSVTEEYFVLVAPNQNGNASLRPTYTLDGTFDLPDPPLGQKSWILCVVPHTPDAVPTSLWARTLWPWVMGARINGGVAGTLASDHTIIHHYTQSDGTTTRLFVSPGATGKFAKRSDPTNIRDYTDAEFVEWLPQGEPVVRPLSVLTNDDRQELEKIRYQAKLSGLLTW